jgi:hypothetical protein
VHNALRTADPFRRSFCWSIHRASFVAAHETSQSEETNKAGKSPFAGAVISHIR